MEEGKFKAYNLPRLSFRKFLGGHNRSFKRLHHSVSNLFEIHFGINVKKHPPILTVDLLDLMNLGGNFAKKTL
jgi:hypothetical protein